LNADNGVAVGLVFIETLKSVSKPTPTRTIMPTTIYHNHDAQPELILSKTIAVIGYGAQGQAHALNLRDSGCSVLIGQREGGRGWNEAQQDGFEPLPIAEAVAQADLICLMIPDEHHGTVFRELVLPQLKSNASVLTCHGFSFHYGLVERSTGYKRILVAPKGQGHMVRGEYQRGGGVPCLLAVDDDSDTEALGIGLAYAWAIGGTRAGVILTSIAAETETDLFGEQAVLCGGLTQLVQAGFETLVRAGYQPELAYFECLHELKIVIDLLQVGGIGYMRDLISTTAEYGDVTCGPQVIDGHVRENMQQLLKRIQSGEFAREFLRECEAGQPSILASRKKTAESEIEKIGERLRGMMPWLQGG
jgi:ketol-acid reductoisomerase